MIRLDNIIATYTTQRGQVNAVDGVTLEIPDSVVMGIAGESGCGKSTLMKVLYGDIGFPLSLSAGAVDYGFANEAGEPVTTDNIRSEWFRHISYIPQSSMSSLNPVVRIREQFVDFPATAGRRKEVLAQVRSYVQKLGLPPESIDAYPHQLSGGMRQRIMVAMATFFQPKIILADEPTTALDVVVQRGVVQLLKDVQRELQNTIILVTHDMGVHANIADRIGIMYAGKIVEEATTEKIFGEPAHPYTQYLINSLPKFGDKTTRESVPGSPPSLANLPSGCPFHPRCPFAKNICKEQMPGFTQLGSNHRVACWLVGEGDNGKVA
jgi:peptide/nickel transport system ATP-binding protein